MLSRISNSDIYGREIEMNENLSKPFTQSCVLVKIFTNGEHLGKYKTRFLSHTSVALWFQFMQLEPIELEYLFIVDNIYIKIHRFI